MHLPLLILLACGSADAPEESPRLERITESPSKQGRAVKGPAPELTGPNVMTRSRKSAIGGQAELLATCIKAHPTVGQVAVEVTVTDGSVTAAKVTEAGEADPAFSKCLADKAVGMPHATNGTSTITLTAM